MSTPATLPGLALWLDATQTAYSDAGITVATAPFGRVAQIAQPAPLSGNWTASGSGRPWREANALDMHLANPTTLTAPPATITANNCTFATAWHHRRGQGIFSPWLATTSGAPFSLYCSGLLYLGSPGGYAAVSGLPNPMVVAGHLTAKCTLIVTCTPTQYAIRLTVNGTLYTATVAIAPAAGAIGAVSICPVPVGGVAAATQHAVSQFVVCQGALNGTDQAALETYLLANLPNDPPVAAPLVVIAGDSIAAAWDPAVQSSFDASANPPRMLNMGVAGSHTTLSSETPSYYVTDALHYYSTARAMNILVMEGISVNDLGYCLGLGQTPEAAAANALAGYYAYLDRVKADGWIVVACTLSPNLAGPSMDAARAILNRDIRANWPGHAHFLWDNGAIPGMATTADAGNAAIFYDGTHITAAGYAVWDASFAPVLSAALAYNGTATEASWPVSPTWPTAVSWPH